MMPPEPDPIPADTPVRPAAQPSPGPSLGARLLGLAFVCFCFEIGVFLVVFPWMPVWEDNMLPALAPLLEDIWGNPFFRGALSGVGLVNVYISFTEMVRLVRGYNGNSGLED